MKAKLAGLLAVVGLLGSVHGAVTINTRNFTTTANGITILDGSGSAATNTTFFAAGTFAPGTDFNVSVADLLTGFSLVSSINTVGSPFAGVLNTPVTYNGGTSGAPTSVVGSNIYVVMGNAASLVDSTLLAVFNAGSNFIAGDAAGNAALTVDLVSSAQVVYGKVSTPADAQPANPSFNFPASVQLVNVPEPSIALLGGLGLLGLLRRRRN